jgi:hypothetical protein
MARDAGDPARSGTPFWMGPWPRVGVALGMVVLGCFLRAAGGEDPKVGPGPEMSLVRFLLIVAAMILAGGAVERMLRRLRPDENSRLEVSSLTAVASLVPLLGYLSVPPGWDSAQMVLVAFIVAGVLGTGLILLPVIYRKAVFAVLVIFHFGGILTATLIVPAPGQQAPWLPSHAWAQFYRPYLGFMYLNNAYHFYSPEPGPATLMWSYVIYEKEKTGELAGEWVKLPDRDASPITLHFQRLLALTDSINQLTSGIPDKRFKEIEYWRREAGGRIFDNAKDLPRFPKRPGLPEEVQQQQQLVEQLLHPHPNMIMARQYQDPQPNSKMLLASYARHLAITHERLKDDPAYTFHSVKIYRVIHHILEPGELAAGFSPLDKTLFHPYFQGEFDKDGKVVYTPDWLQFTDQSFTALREAKVPERVLDKLNDMKKTRFANKKELLDALPNDKEVREYQNELLKYSVIPTQVLVNDLGAPLTPDPSNKDAYWGSFPNNVTIGGLPPRLYATDLDPFLYWLVPITRRNVTVDPNNTQVVLAPVDPDADLINGLELHAKYIPAKPKEGDAPLEAPR